MAAATVATNAPATTPSKRKLTTTPNETVIATTSKTDRDPGRVHAELQAFGASSAVSEAVQRGRRDERNDRKRGTGERDAEPRLRRVVEGGEPLRERHGQQERKQHHPGDDHPELLEQAVIAVPKLHAVQIVVQSGQPAPGSRAPTGHLT